MYSNSPNGATSSWIVRTSTPKKMSVYDFDPGPSTSFDPIGSLPRFNLVGQSSSKPKIKKNSILAMICEAIEAVGSSNKGASYIAIYKWISNRKNIHPKSLRTYIKKEISKGLKIGLLKRSSTSKKTVGVQGHFIVNANYSSHNSRSSNVKPKFKITKDVKARRKQATTSRSVEESQDPSPQSVLASIMKTKDTFEEAAQSILQQASKVLEVATKLIEASNSLVQNKVLEQNTLAINPDLQMQSVAPIQSCQNEEARIASMKSAQGEARVALMQPVQGQARVAPIQPVQGEARVAPMQPVQGEARVAPMQPVQGEARVTPMQPVQGEARVAPMQSVQDKNTRISQINLYHAEKEPTVPIPYSQGREKRIVPIQHPQNEENQSASMQSPSVVEIGVDSTFSPQNELLRVARIKSSQNGEAQVASVQQFQSLETQIASNHSLLKVDSSVDQCSSTFQKMNDTQRGELSNEELSMQRSLNLSSDSSFGVEAEVSNLIQHLEKSV